MTEIPTLPHWEEEIPWKNIDEKLFYDNHFVDLKDSDVILFLAMIPVLSPYCAYDKSIYEIYLRQCFTCENPFIERLLSR